MLLGGKCASGHHILSACLYPNRTKISSWDAQLALLWTSYLALNKIKYWIIWQYCNISNVKSIAFFNDAANNLSKNGNKNNLHISISDSPDWVNIDRLIIITIRFPVLRTISWYFKITKILWLSGHGPATLLSEQKSFCRFKIFPGSYATRSQTIPLACLTLTLTYYQGVYSLQ